MDTLKTIYVLDIITRYNYLKYEQQYLSHTTATTAGSYSPCKIQANLNRDQQKLVTDERRNLLTIATAKRYNINIIKFIDFFLHTPLLRYS
jgi:hypothetical protein